MLKKKGLGARREPARKWKRECEVRRGCGFLTATSDFGTNALDDAAFGQIGFVHKPSKTSLRESGQQVFSVIEAGALDPGEEIALAWTAHSWICAGQGSLCWRCVRGRVPVVRPVPHKSLVDVEEAAFRRKTVNERGLALEQLLLVFRSEDWEDEIMGKLGFALHELAEGRVTFFVRAAVHVFLEALKACAGCAANVEVACSAMKNDVDNVGVIHCSLILLSDACEGAKITGPVSGASKSLGATCKYLSPVEGASLMRSRGRQVLG